MGGFRNSILGGINLIREAIQSPNFVSGSTGWWIGQDGSAEFNDLTVRGQFDGQDFIVNSSGIFLYSGTPAAGNLIGSWAPAAGTDAFGNTYRAGLELHSTDGSVVQLLSGSSFGTSAHFLPATDTGSTWADGVILADYNSGTPDVPFLALYSPYEQTNPNGSAGVSGITLTGEGKTGSPRVIDLMADSVTLSSGPITLSGETWQTPSYGSGWAAGPSAGTVQSCRFRRDGEDNVRIVGAFHSTSTTPAATVFTLPAGYRPKVTHRAVGVSNQGGTATARYIEVNSSGAVSVNANLTTSGTDVYLELTVPLGNIT